MAALSVTAADVSVMPQTIVRTFNAGGAVSLGDSVYVVSDDDVEKSNGGAAGTATGRGVVVAIENGKTVAVANDAVTVALYGPVAGFDSLTPGAPGYVSDTAGEIDTGVGTVTWVMGWALTARMFFVNPQVV